MFKQQARRLALSIQRSMCPYPESDEAIIEFTRKPSHPALNDFSGLLILPDRFYPSGKYGDMAHKYGVKVLVDGAHAIAHFVFKISHQLRLLRC
jgi:hypothetical protein